MTYHLRGNSLCPRVVLSLLLAGAVVRGPAAQSPPAQPPTAGPRSADELMAVVDPLIRSAMTNDRIPGAAFVFVRDGRVLVSRGYGLADVERNLPVRPESTLFRIGSISKIFAATALMQLVDRGRVDLHRDVNTYLKGVTVPDTFPSPVTPHHLLSHTAGLDEIGAGRRASRQAGLLPLSQFLADRLVRTAPPGELPAYSTYGITLAGLLVEQVSGMPFEAYLRQHLWQPLGMQRTAITLSPELQGDLATGYELRNGALTPQPYEWYHTTPASSINATPLDVARFMLAFLEPPTNRAAPILSPAIQEVMLATQERGHPAVPGVAYGFFEGHYGGERVLEHGGMMAGVSSSLVLLPDRRSGFFIVHHFEGHGLRDEVRTAILDRFYAQVAMPPPPIVQSDLRRFAGRYRWNVYCRSCPGNPPTQGPSVEAASDGTLRFAGQAWIQTGPLLFRRVDGKRVLGFRENADGHITHLFIDGPLTFERIR